VIFRSAVNGLAWRGRLVEIAATGQREVSFDLVDFYRNDSRLFGVDTLKRDFTASAEVLDALQVANGATGRIMLRPRD
jgi:NADPH2:quinone reductase